MMEAGEVGDCRYSPENRFAQDVAVALETDALPARKG